MKTVRFKTFLFVAFYFCWNGLIQTEDPNQPNKAKHLFPITPQVALVIKDLKSDSPKQGNKTV